MPPISRRRLVVAGALGGLSLALPARAQGAAEIRWRGSALGAAAEMRLLHPDPDAARRLIAGCLDEIERLEGVFSLWRVDSALSRLNRDGRLDAPPLDLVALLGRALALAEASGGAFDPTVQPLYALVAAHFARPGADPAGPPRSALAAALERVAYRAVAVTPGRIEFRRPGMAMTLNGIAQGYVTDRIAERLRAAGVRDLLVELGEIRGLGRGPNGRPWRAGLADPRDSASVLARVPVGEGSGALPALAMSGGYGTRFGGRWHHLLDPASGTSACRHAAVAVAALDATVADGLSTALSVVPQDRAAGLIARLGGGRAWMIDDAGAIVRVEA